MSRAEIAFFEATQLDTGLFSYTFRRGDQSFVWGFENGRGQIQLYFPGVVAVEDPPGWSHSFDSSGRIFWTVPDGPIFLDDLVTFTVRSCLDAVTTYRGFPPDRLGGPYGAIFADLYELPDYTRLPFVGYQALDYVGPVLPVLAVQGAGSDVILRGSAVSDGFILEASDRLGPGAQWLPVPEAITVSNFEFTLRLPATGGLRFFRLQHPCLQ